MVFMREIIYSWKDIQGIWHAPPWHAWFPPWLVLNPPWLFSLLLDTSTICYSLCWVEGHTLNTFEGVAPKFIPRIHLVQTLIPWYHWASQRDWRMTCDLSSLQPQHHQCAIFPLRYLSEQCCLYPLFFNICFEFSLWISICESSLCGHVIISIKLL